MIRLKKSIVNFFLVILILPFILGGCVPNVAVKDKEKTTTDYLKGEVVKGFPNVPVYPKSQVVESYGKDGKYGAILVSDEKLAKVVKFFSDSLKTLGWESRLNQRSATNYIFEITNATNKGEIIVNTAADGAKTAITIAIEPGK